jgi:uncharacterized protein involved in response to NO
MSTATLRQIEPTTVRPAENAIARERGAQRLVTAFILTGLAFMLLPGTFLGVWNLISISESHSVTALSAAWIQAHGHAQIFGWIGTFILGIGLYSLQKMQRSAPFPLSRGWMCLAIWTTGVLLRWVTNIYRWQWRTLLPVSAGLELVAFALFYRSVRRHRTADPNAKREAWMTLVGASSIGFLATLLCNLGLTVFVALNNSGPAFPHALDQRVLVLSTWGFLVLAIWGFNAKWLPVFIGLRIPSERGLIIGLTVNLTGVGFALLGLVRLSALLLLGGATIVILALHIFEKAERPPKILNVHVSFPAYVRIAYVWLAAAALLTVWAAGGDHAGGIWGASRHALTVGFIAVMVFAIGQRVLPAFCGMKILFSPALMFWSMLLLNAGCFLRVASEIPAYEGYWRGAWHVLPFSAVVELAAVTLFATNLSMSILKPTTKLSKEFA